MQKILAYTFIYAIIKIGKEVNKMTNKINNQQEKVKVIDHKSNLLNKLHLEHTKKVGDCVIELLKEQTDNNDFNNIDSQQLGQKIVKKVDVLNYHYEKEKTHIKEMFETPSFKRLSIMVFDNSETTCNFIIKFYRKANNNDLDNIMIAITKDNVLKRDLTDNLQYALKETALAVAPFFRKGINYKLNTTYNGFHEYLTELKKIGYKVENNAHSATHFGWEITK